MLSGAQQTILVDSLQGINPQEARTRLCNDSNEPRWTVVFAWQSHLMFLAWSLVFYLAGLTSYIASPVVRKPEWNDDAKVLDSPDNSSVTRLPLLDSALLCGNSSGRWAYLCCFVSADS